MTTDKAPPNDTGAPDTSRAHIERLIQCAPFADQTAGIPEMVTALRALLAERDLAAAQAAAAYRQGLHDGITKAANRYWVGSEPDKWDYFSAARNAMLDLKTFEFPAPEGQAVLDRLIAERVREAVEAEREACAKVAEHPATPGIAAAIRARASKEGRDG